ncbi:MAG TPA: hypothetical protein DCX12_08340 [Chloroflexi bacterium]|jgi:transposase|nr:hypothetical protein [Chloroflexota bacterium]
MKEDSVTLSHTEQQRLLVLDDLEAGIVISAAAAELLGISVRQVRRLRAAYRERGAAALAHGNRGRRPAHALDPALAARVVQLATSTDAGFNRQHLTEMLAEHHGIVLSRPTVHRILATAGCPRRAVGDRQGTGSGGTATPGRACCSRSTAAVTTGWSAGVPTSP